MEHRLIKFNGQDLKVNLRDDVDASVANEIFKYREYRVCDGTIREAVDPILDVGAHAGFFTLYARALNPTVAIIAVEPEPSNVRMLERHLEENNIVGVEVVRAVLAGASEKRKLLLSNDSHNHSLASHDATEKSNVLAIQAWSLTDLCERYKTVRVSLLKMDIEGAEYEIIASWEENDFKRVGAIIMEYHDSAENRHENLEDILRQRGFSVQIFPSQFDKSMGFMYGRNKRML